MTTCWRICFPSAYSHPPFLQAMPQFYHPSLPPPLPPSPPGTRSPLLATSSSSPLPSPCLAIVSLHPLPPASSGHSTLLTCHYPPHRAGSEGIPRETIAASVRGTVRSPPSTPRTTCST